MGFFLYLKYKRREFLVKEIITIHGAAQNFKSSPFPLYIEGLYESFLLIYERWSYEVC
jgi:hypothetical protein